MGEARFVQDMSVGAKRYWLRQPFQEHDYVIVAPEPSSGRTSVYAATHDSDIIDVKDENGDPLALARFEGQIALEEALARLGYQVAGSEASNVGAPYIDDQEAPAA